MNHWTSKLPANACSEAVRWCKTQPSAAAAWDNCEQAGWMFWMLGQTDADRKKLVLAACGCARLALKHTKDPRVLACIETTESWARGEATLDQVIKARKNAHAAAYAAAYASDAAAHVAIRKNVYKQCCDVIRQNFPKPPKLDS